MTDRPDPVQQPSASFPSNDRPEPSLGAGPPAPALDPANEKVLWAGHASWKTLYIPLATLVLLAVVVVLVTQLLLRNAAATYTVLAVFAVLLVILVVRTAWRVWGTSYRLTNQRIFVRRGIFSQTVDQTELIRVDDVKLGQTLVQRMLGLGQVEVITNDRTDPAIIFRDIEEPDVVTEHIRRNTRTLQRRTVFMEQL